MSDTQQEVISKLIDMGYSKDVAEKMAKSLKGMKRQLASEDVVDKINNLIKESK